MKQSQKTGPYAVRYAAGKRREWEEYRVRISPWELDNYLTNYRASCPGRGWSLWSALW